MVSSRRSGRSKFTLALLVLTSITLLTLDFRGFGPLQNARSTVLGVFTPVGDFFGNVFEPVGDAWSGAFDQRDLAKENEELRRQIDDLEGQVTSGEVAKESNRRLLEQARIEYLGDVETVQARVVGGSISNFDTTITIDKGESSGIAVDMPVVTGKGLIGRVVQTSPSSATVELLTSGDFAVGFTAVGSNVQGVLSGVSDGGGLRGTVDVTGNVHPEQLLVTSGTLGSPYPQGIPIGTLSAVSDQPSSLERSLDIQMSADVSDLTYVTVVLWQAPVIGG